RLIAFGAHLVEERPAVGAGDHQVEHDEVRLLEPQLAERAVAVVDGLDPEPSRGQMPPHPLLEDRVVLHDHHRRHPGTGRRPAHPRADVYWEPPSPDGTRWA